MINFPSISPIFLHIGPLQLRWYGLAYVCGISLGALVIKKRLQQAGFTTDDWLNLITAIAIGVLLGGRLGYILLYDLPFYLIHPLEIVAFWHGGMAYHGGALGCLASIIWFCKTTKKPILPVLDSVSLASPLGIFFGRIANFINGELYGRPTTAPWGMVFPQGGPLPRHPSQLYEAFGEGLLLFGFLWIATRFFRLKPGQGVALYLIGYGFLRLGLEFFRQPDPQLGFIIGPFTLGQLLCGLMIVAGLSIACRNTVIKKLLIN